MKKCLTIAMVLAVLCLLVLGVMPVAAADPVITVYSNVPLVINGILADKLPATVSPGSIVSVITPLYYTSQGERWTFLGWSDGSSGTSIAPANPGTYIALWSRAVLIQITSAIPGLQKSLWLPYNVPYQLTATDVIQVSETVRYRFLQWTGGETPYLVNNTLVPLLAMTVEAKYVKEYLLTITAPGGIAILGTGWYADGSSLVLQAPQDVYDAAKTSRQHFSSWESVGYPVMVVPGPTTAVTTIKVDGAYTLRANYDKQYLVVAKSPFGELKREWIKEGAEVQLEACPASVEIVPDQEQFVFQRWTGMEGLISPKVSGVITQAVQLNAVYEHQYMVTLNAPNGGSGEGWYKEGSVASITVPLTSQNGLYQVSRFTGFAGYTGQDGITQVLVQAPTTVTANYSNGLDLRVLGIIIGCVLILAGMAVWGFGRRRKA